MAKCGPHPAGDQGRGQTGRSLGTDRLQYLNGTVNVTEDKRERIAKAIKELGYRPSIVARALCRTRRMDSVVVFAANPSAFSTSKNGPWGGGRRP